MSNVFICLNFKNDTYSREKCSASLLIASFVETFKADHVAGYIEKRLINLLNQEGVGWKECV